jgi:hypothetical protein
MDETMTYVPGDPNHLGVHNDLVTATAAAAARAGVDVVLPDTAHLGDTGHVSDHNLLADALAIIAAAPGGMTWAKVSGGTVTTVTNADGSVDSVHTFTAATGILTVEEPGYARVLLVSGAGGGTSAQFSGGGGRIVSGIHSLPVGALPVVVGATGENGRAAAAYPAGGWGKASNLGSLTTGKAGPWGSSNSVPDQITATGFTSDISGTPVEYSRVDDASNTPGSATSTGAVPGHAGVVIVRVRTSPPTVSGVAATGGTVTEYTGDGTNGVLGQKYRVHTFTSPTDYLVVAQGGPADLFMISGGCGWRGDVGGGYTGGGLVIDRPITLVPTTYPVIVGAGGVRGNTYADVAGKPSSLGALTTGVALGNAASGATMADEGKPYTSSITGTPQTYGLGASSRPNRGDSNGAAGAGGTSGVVIVRYEIA